MGGGGSGRGGGGWGGGDGDNAIQYSTALEQFGNIYTQTHFACTHYHKWQRIFLICDHIMQTHFAFTHYHK